jgi:hypothetical protein
LLELFPFDKQIISGGDVVHLAYRLRLLLFPLRLFLTAKHKFLKEVSLRDDVHLLNLRHNALVNIELFLLVSQHLLRCRRRPADLFRLLVLRNSRYTRWRPLVDEPDLFNFFFLHQVEQLVLILPQFPILMCLPYLFVRSFIVTT